MSKHYILNEWYESKGHEAKTNHHPKTDYAVIVR
jgi:hypothetical protein